MVCPAQACAQTAFYFNAQKVGTLPATNDVSWRGNALTNETTPSGASISGTQFCCWQSGSGVSLPPLRLRQLFKLQCRHACVLLCSRRCGQGTSLKAASLSQPALLVSMTAAT